MTKYLTSEQVKVFPTAYRGKNASNKIFDPESRLNTEKNLTRIASKITSHDSFVINRDFELHANETEKLEVCLKGYLFELTLSYSDLEEFKSEGGVIYASVNIEPKNPDYSTDTTNTEYEGLSLSPFGEGQTSLDNNNGEFIGLTLDNNDGDLVILENINNSWVVPSSSILRLDTELIENDLNRGVSIKKEFHTGDIFIDSPKADEDSIWSLTIDDSGLIQSEDLTYNNTKPTGNDYSFIDSITETSQGHISVTRHNIPDADANHKGLLNTLSQEVSGTKVFKDGIQSASISNSASSSMEINSTSDINIESYSGSINLTTLNGEGKSYYNGEEIATKDFMRREGTSSYATKIGSPTYHPAIGNSFLPTYVNAKGVVTLCSNGQYGRTSVNMDYRNIYRVSVNSNNDTSFNNIVFPEYPEDNIRVSKGSFLASPTIPTESYYGSGLLSFSILSTSINKMQGSDCTIFKIDLYDLLPYFLSSIDFNKFDFNIFDFNYNPTGVNVQLNYANMKEGHTDQSYYPKHPWTQIIMGNLYIAIDNPFDNVTSIDVSLSIGVKFKSN